MDSALKKVSYSVFLDPTQNESDYFAYKIMQRWAQQQKQFAQDPKAAVQLHNQIHVHKDIYLSGLYLHQLKPELAKALASGLTQDTINNQTLTAMLEAHQVIDRARPQADKSVTDSVSMITESVNRLDEICGATIEQVVKAEVDSETIVSALKTALSPQHESMISELQGLRALVKDQQKLIEQLIHQAGSVEHKAVANVSEIKPISDVDTRMSNVQKVKKKGIF
ncbi:hypothetical protein [Vibrio astriarenae]|uniref:hypothetical protein n=1 Tax=Vibrio astriarenae TaxID=1481923 RepID=UPI003736D47F